MGSAIQGPFGATRPNLQNTAVETPVDSRAPNLTHPLPAKPATQIPGLSTTGPGRSAGAQKTPLSSIPREKNRYKTRPRPSSPLRGGLTISAPSAASGGIPEPTPAYLLRASFVPLPAPAPRPLLVVIDLNGTLLYRPNKRSPSRFVERPLARAFLEACLDKPNHHVVIWSSARPANVERMCAQLLAPEQLAKVVAVWGRDRFGLSQDDYNRRTQCYKRLTRLWSDPVVAASHPEGVPWNQGNTVLIDDSPEKARSEPHNAITLPEFAGDINEQPQVLSLVQEYLETLAWQMDISTYIRARPFAVEIEK
ncbi:FCP1 homology domain-containing protein [Madurella fahalii]|uniref:Mitochondrial import inner membrane translocase subunit TIM50 n=1 Tax=Madurella fahalii TaxID=1157608 RepID=A0ABQ0GAV8_9PEZI